MTVVAKEWVQEARVRWWLMALLACACTTVPVRATTDISNAALLYYQAMVRSPDMDRFPDEMVEDVLRGTASAEDVRFYVSRWGYGAVLETVAAAAQAPECDWGLRILDRTFEGEAVKRARAIQFLFGASARVLIEDGKRTDAFVQLMQLRQFAAHAAAEPGLSETLPWNLESSALNFWRYTMGLAPVDGELLTWLEDKLTFDPIPPDWLPKLLDFYLNRTLLTLRANSSGLTSIRTNIPTMSSPVYRAKVEAYADMDDEELIELIRQTYQAFLNDVFAVLETDPPFAEGYQRLTSLAEALFRAASDEPTINVDLLSTARFIPEYYSGLFYHKAQLHALRAAVEIYRVRVQTGQLPQTLPTGLPRDPYSAEDFEYEVTSEGFILRSASKRAYSDLPVEFEFRVQN